MLLMGINPLFLWPCSSSQTVSHYQRVSIKNSRGNASHDADIRRHWGERHSRKTPQGSWANDPKGKQSWLPWSQFVFLPVIDGLYMAYPWLAYGYIYYIWLHIYIYIWVDYHNSQTWKVQLFWDSYLLRIIIPIEVAESFFTTDPDPCEIRIREKVMYVMSP